MLKPDLWLFVAFLIYTPVADFTIPSDTLLLAYYGGLKHR